MAVQHLGARELLESPWLGLQHLLLAPLRSRTQVLYQEQFP